MLIILLEQGMMKEQSSCDVNTICKRNMLVGRRYNYVFLSPGRYVRLARTMPVPDCEDGGDWRKFWWSLKCISSAVEIRL